MWHGGVGAAYPLTGSFAEGGEYKSIGQFKWATTGVIRADGRAFVE